MKGKIKKVKFSYDVRLDFAAEVTELIRQDVDDDEFERNQWDEFEYSDWRELIPSPSELSANEFSCEEIEISDASDADIELAKEKGWRGEESFVIDTSGRPNGYELFARKCALDSDGESDFELDVEKLEIILADKYMEKEDTWDAGFSILADAAKRGNEEAAYHLAEIYAQGIGVEKNVDLAIEYLKMAQGLGQAYLYLYLLKKDSNSYHFITYDDVDFLMTHTKMTEALKIGTRFNDSSHIDFDCCMDDDSAAFFWYSVGKCFYYGVPPFGQNFTSAFDYFNCSLTFDYGASDIGAMYYIGLMYLNGQCVPRNLFKAKEWFEKAIDFGHEKSKQKLDEVKALIETEKPNEDKQTIEWLTQFEIGYTDPSLQSLNAMYRLGFNYIGYVNHALEAIYNDLWDLKNIDQPTVKAARELLEVMPMKIMDDDPEFTELLSKIASMEIS